MPQASASSSRTEIPLILDDAARSLAAAGIKSARLDAQILLAEAAQVDRARVLAGAIDYSAPVRARFESMLARRIAREPIAYILGRREFYSLEFEVNPDVLIPRPQTEAVVDMALEFIAGVSDACVLDICTGPGTIAIALAANAPHAAIVATDVSEAALATARRNAERNGVAERIEFVRSDLFARVDSGPALGQFDLIVSNPPYVVSGDIGSLEPDVRNFEPRGALDGGPDGLDFFRRIGAAAKSHLRPEGLLVLEVGDGQDGAVEEILTYAGMRLAGVRKDLDGITRVVTARL